MVYDPAVIKWEYLTMTADLDHFDEIQEGLNSVGVDGWEAVGFTTIPRTGKWPALYRVLLKRPII